MLKKDLMQRVEAEGINLSEYMFERYYEYGLIVSDKDGQCRMRGVKTYYHKRTMEAIRFIEELKANKAMGNQKNYIFILYWKGYPVQWDKLKARLLKFHSGIMDYFNTVTGYLASPTMRITSTVSPRTRLIKRLSQWGALLSNPLRLRRKKLMIQLEDTFLSAS
ncbi:hypothetical protein [Paenibacillus wynnii]|uniref:hypothetical protein n=1 Tax=Paenibacillus wynnii TaxID=268407 RepID=UPI002791FB3D|nr:hypothetical protein [Paenibacillus wynnii]MDQ0192526.1 hypothetical protein [Paenibacillus wynnii]